jgi:hypothetical protein
VDDLGHVEADVSFHALQEFGLGLGLGHAGHLDELVLPLEDDGGDLGLTLLDCLFAAFEASADWWEAPGGEGFLLLAGGPHFGEAAFGLADLPAGGVSASNFAALQGGRSASTAARWDGLMSS